MKRISMFFAVVLALSAAAWADLAILPNELEGVKLGMTLKAFVKVRPGAQNMKFFPEPDEDLTPDPDAENALLAEKLPETSGSDYKAVLYAFENKELVGISLQSDRKKTKSPMKTMAAEVVKRMEAPKTVRIVKEGTAYGSVTWETDDRYVNLRFPVTSVMESKAIALQADSEPCVTLSIMHLETAQKHGVSDEEPEENLAKVISKEDIQKLLPLLKTELSKMQQPQ